MGTFNNTIDGPQNENAIEGVSINGRGVTGRSDTSYGMRAHSQKSAGLRASSDESRGLEGWATSAEGVVGISKNATGVWGQAEGGGSGVLGTSKSGIGVVGQSESSEGVRGQSSARHHGGVVGINSADGPGIYGTSTTGTGVSGRSENGVGVFGTSEHHEGVHAETRSMTTAAIAVYQSNPNSERPALYARHAGGRVVALFEGSLVVTGDIDLTGPGSDIRLTNADCAEDFDVRGATKSEPGTVMVLGDDGALSESSRAYDRRVAGVVSGAGEYKPAIVLDSRRDTTENRQPIALVGKVLCKVDAQFGAIAVGDLLTTSSTRGHAMTASDPARSFGTIIGKALRPFPSGRGLIPVLVALR
jgi:hypothetical protein